jgi:hypothetical protein
MGVVARTGPDAIGTSCSKQWMEGALFWGQYGSIGRKKPATSIAKFLVLRQDQRGF